MSDKLSSGVLAAFSPRERTFLRWLGMAFLLIVVVAVARATSNPVTPAPPATPAPPGATLSTNAWTWTVTDAKSLGPTLSRTIDTRTIDGRWVQVTITWHNALDVARRPPAPVIVDGEGRTFERSRHAETWHVPNEQDCFLEELNPGLTRACTYLYPLPHDAKDLDVVYRGDRVGPLHP